MKLAQDEALLRSTLASVLSTHLGRQFHIERLTRTPIAYASSYAIEELLVQSTAGETLHVVFKDLGPDARLPWGTHCKPAFLCDPTREISTYRSLLEPFVPSVPVCYGADIDVNARRYWLLLEKAPGEQIVQCGDIKLWKRAIELLACIHARYLPGQHPIEDSNHLVKLTPEFYRRWCTRAVDFTRAASNEDRKFLLRLANDADRMIAPLLAWPQTLIHGECYPANVLADEVSGRVTFIDWETAGIGPGLMDLAALTAGKWNASQKVDLALAYYAAIKELGANVPSSDEFLHTLDFARLQVALQWLGWSEDWEPPKDHAHGWLDEARELASSLRLIA